MVLDFNPSLLTTPSRGSCQQRLRQCGIAEVNPHTKPFRHHYIRATNQSTTYIAAPCIAFFAIYARTYAQERADENLLKIIMPRP